MENNSDGTTWEELAAIAGRAFLAMSTKAWQLTLALAGGGAFGAAQRMGMHDWIICAIGFSALVFVVFYIIEIGKEYSDLKKTRPLRSATARLRELKISGEQCLQRFSNAEFPESPIRFSHLRDKASPMMSEAREWTEQVKAVLISMQWKERDWLFEQEEPEIKRIYLEEVRNGTQERQVVIFLRHRLYRLEQIIDQLPQPTKPLCT